MEHDPAVDRNPLPWRVFADSGRARGIEDANGNLLLWAPAAVTGRIVAAVNRLPEAERCFVANHEARLDAADGMAAALRAERDEARERTNVLGAQLAAVLAACDRAEADGVPWLDSRPVLTTDRIRAVVAGETS